MTTIRVTKRNRFTVIDRAATNDDRLSFRARGVLFWLLDKPDDWHTDSNAIARAGTEGRDAVRAALRELEGCGYLTRERKRDKQGRWSTEVFVLERPAPENPSPDDIPEQFDDEPGPENPASENQALSTKDCKPKTDVFRDETIASLSEIPKTMSPWKRLNLTREQYNDLSVSQLEELEEAQS